MLLAIFWAIIFAWILCRSDFVRRSELSIKYLLAAFGAKVVAAILYGYIHWYRYGGADTWDYFRYGQVIYQTLFEHPSYYLKLVFGPINYVSPEEDFRKIIDKIEHWTDERTYIMLRINALIALFSAGHYEVHAVFFAFFSMLGLIGIYRLFVAYYPAHKRLLYYCLFWEPSVLFWGSGMHKEAICIVSLGAILYTFKRFLDKDFLFAHVIYFLFGIILLFLVRPHVGFLLPPVLLAWWSATRFPYYKAVHFVVAYGLLTMVVVLFDAYTPYSVFRILVEMQHNFIAYFIGNTDFYLPTLSPDLQSVLAFIPIALYNMLIVPTLAPFTFQNGVLEYVAAIENSLFLCVAIASLVRTCYYRWSPDVFWYVCILFSLSHVLLMGIITDNLGAIVRYRTLAFVFMPTVLLVYLVRKKE